MEGGLTWAQHGSRLTWQQRTAQFGGWPKWPLPTSRTRARVSPAGCPLNPRAFVPAMTAAEPSAFPQAAQSNRFGMAAESAPPYLGGWDRRHQRGPATGT